MSNKIKQSKSKNSKKSSKTIKISSKAVSNNTEIEIKTYQSKILKDKVIIPDNIIDQIQKYNFASPSEEWSGVIFYSVTEEDNKFIYHVKGLIPLDVGSQTTTEYDVTDPEITHYMVVNDLIDCYMGNMHSHNKMDVFFSATDSKAFEQSNYPIFLSIIVNNAMDIIAKVGFKITTTVKPINSHLHPVTKERVYTEEEETISENYEIRDCILEWNKESTNEYFEQIKEIKRKKEEAKKKLHNNYNYNTHYNNYDQYNMFNNSYDDMDNYYDETTDINDKYGYWDRYAPTTNPKEKKEINTVNNKNIVNTKPSGKKFYDINGTYSLVNTLGENIEVTGEMYYICEKILCFLATGELFCSKSANEVLDKFYINLSSYEISNNDLSSTLEEGLMFALNFYGKEYIEDNLLLCMEEVISNYPNNNLMKEVKSIVELWK